MVGATAFVFDLVLFLLFFRVIGFDYRLANAVGLIGGFFLSFLLNRLFTFAAVRGAVSTSFLRFGLANLLSLTLATLVLCALVQTVGWRTEAAKVVVSMLVPACNYFLYRYFVFVER